MEGKIEIALMLGWVTMVVIVLIVIFFSQNYRNKILIADREKQRIAFKASIEGEEKQKERIANNLHDEIIPTLHVLGQNLRLHKKELKYLSSNFPDFDKNFELLEQSINGMRSIALDLIPTTFLNFGLLKALEQYLNQLNNEERLVQFESSINFKEDIRLSKEKQINIYRICMEVINNLQKHSQYTHLNVSIEKKVNCFKVQFMHDGLGIDNTEIEAFSQNSKGLGLNSIKSRLLILGAEINYSKASEVPTIILTVPLNS